jgi:hypothetical protein
MTSGFYYLLLINFRLKLFEVLYPNTKFNLVSDHVEVAIKNFKMAFNLSYKHSLIKVDGMQTIYRSVCSSDKEYVTSFLCCFVSSVILYKQSCTLQFFVCFVFLIKSYHGYCYVVTIGCDNKLPCHSLCSYHWL